MKSKKHSSCKKACYKITQAFSLWGYLKTKVYKHLSTGIGGIKSAIRLTVEIPQEMTRRVMENFGNLL